MRPSRHLWPLIGLCLLAACSEERGFEPLPDPDGGPPTPEAGMPEAGMPDPDPEPDAAVVCGPDEHTFEGACYACADFDVCAVDQPDYLQHRLACCDADVRFCNEPSPPCPPPEGEPIVEPPVQQVSTCMACHNGAAPGDPAYSGDGISNPHPFPGAQYITCEGCHGGDPGGAGRLGSHVPPPPAIGDRNQRANDFLADFNRRTLAGIDRLGPDPYLDPDGDPVTNLDYLQFVNPGDLRVVSAGRGCGMQGCHGDEHAQWVPRSVLATTTGLFSATRFLVGVDNRIPEHRVDRDGDSLADSAPRAVQNPGYNAADADTGEVGRLAEQPELAQFNGPMLNNAIYDAATLANHVIDDDLDPLKPNRIRAGSPLEALIDEQVSITCGNCHLWSAGDNNRYADFRSSGCTACHMEYSYDGRHRGFDPNVPLDEPANPDQIAPGERAHVEAHQIRNVAKVLPGGAFVRGISDRACVGCHQGSNRTVLQFWGIRLDQNQDLTDDLQYPANPDTFQNTAQDQRLYNPAVGNTEFNGRNANEYILDEDYDGDGRDDTPPDIHYERGMGCIDCHGSRDLHGGTAGDPTSGQIRSRQDQATAIQCESCHGTVQSFAATAPCTTYDGDAAECAVDRRGNVLRHVTQGADGHFWLTSRLDKARHYVPQTRDVTVLSQRTHPITSQALYSPEASYAMGAADGDQATGIGPLQGDPVLNRGFSHLETMDCASCHASWTNNCIGCHLATQYDADPGEYHFSNITGERILLDEANADFVYQSPVMQYLGVNSRGAITKISPAEKVFWRTVDRNGQTSDVFVFSDRLGEGNNPANGGRNDFPALSMNQMMPHSIRGAVDGSNEGPTYCVGCHVNRAMLDDAAVIAEYDAFVEAYDNQAFADIDFDVLQTHIGQNTGNQLNSPFFVRMMAGQGTGLFLFDANGCPVNPLDARADRENCNEQAPADLFADLVNAVVYDLDRIVQFNGVPNSSSAHPLLQDRDGRASRAGASNGQMAGPLGATTLQRLIGGDDIANTGIVLDGWLDADGQPQGTAVELAQ